MRGNGQSKSDSYLTQQMDNMKKLEVQGAPCPKLLVPTIIVNSLFILIFPCLLTLPISLLI